MSLRTKVLTSLFSLASASFIIACQPTKESTSAQATFIPVNQQQIITKTADDLPHYLTRDIQEEVFYFVMPDRFNNGDTTNDLGDANIPLSYGGFDKHKANAYHGGDIKGLKDKLPYLKDLGISSIWLTPILRNQAVQGDISGYHGYWVLDFTEIDPHLGSNEDLKAFIDAAHQENIKVFFDIITNHTADVIKFTECHGEDGSGWSESGEPCLYKSLAQIAEGDAYTTIIPQGMDKVKTPQWLNDPKYYHNQGDSTFSGENSLYGDFFGLDDINTDDPEVVSGMVEIFKKIIDEFKPDGFRIDTVKHVNIEFWQGFAPQLLAHARNNGLPKFFMFGEVYDGNPDVLSYFTTTGKIQSVLDFGFAYATRKVLIDQAGTVELARLFAQDNKYSDHDSNANQLLNFVGNHDMGRFAHELTSSKHNYSANEVASRIKLAHAMMYFLRGIPVVYYGAEQGFVGDGGNHDSRQDMMPSEVASYNDDVLVGTDKTTADDNFDQAHPLYQALAEYASVYYQHKALRFGQQAVVFSQIDSPIFAITRTSDTGEELLVVVNFANKAIELPNSLVQSQQIKLYQSGKSQNDNKLAPLSVTIYQR